MLSSLSRDHAVVLCLTKLAPKTKIISLQLHTLCGDARIYNSNFSKGKSANKKIFRFALYSVTPSTFLNFSHPSFFQVQNRSLTASAMAADDGVKPPTLEFLSICKSLLAGGVAGGV